MLLTNAWFISYQAIWNNNILGGVAEWLKAADCKSARVAYVGSNPTPTTIVDKQGITKGDTLWI